VLDAHQPRAVDSLATLMEADGWAREEARTRAWRQVGAART
jgi:hypothetical protein